MDTAEDSYLIFVHQNLFDYWKHGKAYQSIYQNTADHSRPYIRVYQIIAKDIRPYALNQAVLQFSMQF